MTSSQSPIFNALMPNDIAFYPLSTPPITYCAPILGANSSSNCFTSLPSTYQLEFKISNAFFHIPPYTGEPLFKSLNGTTICLHVN